MPLAKDFVETSEGLVFAVVETGLEDGKVLCFLRYILLDSHWQKVNTDQANQYLIDHYSHYLYYSPIRQAHCHAVEYDQIYKHHHPRVKLKQLLVSPTSDDVETDLMQLCQLLVKQGFNLNEAGVTGSVLISAQKVSSDIDLVFYSRASFNKAREIVKALIKSGECHELTEDDWIESYDRRACDLTYDDYVWHEKRKFNKALINHRKFDLSFVAEDKPQPKTIRYEKRQKIKLQAQVTDDYLGFDYPAEFTIQNDQIQAVICYTATYTGQALKGEWIEVAGQLEESSEGVRRIVVGSSREASGEYIKVINVKTN